MVLFLRFVVLLFISASAYGQVQLAVPDVSGASGSLIVVPVTLGEGRGITALQFTLNFDASALSLAADDAIVPGPLLADHSIGVSRSPGKVKIVIFSGSHSSLKAGAGAVVNVAFLAARGLTAGTPLRIGITGVQASDAASAAVALGTRDGTVTLAPGAGAPIAGANDLVFPHIVNGSFDGGSFVTSLFFSGLMGAATAGEVRFFLSDGSPMTVRLLGGQSGTAFPFSIPENGSAFLQTDGSGALSVGYARVITASPVGGTVLFGQRDASGRTVTEAGVGVAPAASRFSVPLLYTRGSANTGVAFANASSQAVDLSLVLRDASGAALLTSTARLEAGRHLPRFATEYFETLGERAEFLGSIEVHSTGPVSAVALKLQGQLLTTFPVVEPR
jgi:hypothetical protein